MNLAGVPSIVHALFGLGAFVLFAGMGRSILAASLTLAIMTLPVIIASTKEALSSVPMSFREACWNVGATRWQTIRGIVLPNSISGILTGVILQVSRTAGETAPIMFTGAVFFKPASRRATRSPTAFPTNAWPCPCTFFTITTQVTDAPKALPYATAVVLLGTVLCVNALPRFCCACGCALEKNGDAGVRAPAAGTTGAAAEDPESAISGFRSARTR